MNVSKVFAYIVVVLFSAPKVRGVDQNDTNSYTITGFGYEMISAKLEYLQYKLNEIESAVKEDRETIDQNLFTIKNNNENMDQKLLEGISQLIQTFDNSLNPLHIKLNDILNEQAAKADQERMRKEIQTLVSKKDVARFLITSGMYARSISFPSCKWEPSELSGKYLIQPTENDEPFLGYCDQTIFGGGWLVIQHRYKGSLDFYRNWVEYKNGFGSVDGEFWLGLELLHSLTSARSHELLVELKDFSGNYVFARYSEFAIGSEAEQYPLAKLGLYTGTAGDSLEPHKGMKFSTKDRDNDITKKQNCATDYKGAWWYKGCHKSNLNGRYMDVKDPQAICWYHYKSSYQGLAYSRMLIRETQS